MTNPIFPGNAINFPHFFKDEAWESIPKMLFYHILGYATLTTALQTSIDIYVPSHNKEVADALLTVPSGAIVYFLGLRLPNSTNASENHLPGNLKAGATLVGTTGEKLKVGTAHTDAVPAITSASSAYTPNASASSAGSPWATLAAPLGTLGGATAYKVLCSNAGNTAAGTGIKTSADTARILVEIAYCIAAGVSDLSKMGYPSPYQG